jgi:hypothetical protein
MSIESGGMYCRECDYDLRGSPEPRCSECGQSFDPDDPRTFRRKPRRLKPLALVLAIYWIPLAAHAVFLLTMSLPVTWPLKTRLLAVGGSMAGPFLPLLTPVGATVIGPLLWLVWSVALWRTRVGSLPYAIHVLIVVIWIWADRLLWPCL